MVQCSPPKDKQEWKHYIECAVTHCYETTSVLRTNEVKLEHCCTKLEPQCAIQCCYSSVHQYTARTLGVLLYVSSKVHSLLQAVYTIHCAVHNAQSSFYSAGLAMQSWAPHELPSPHHSVGAVLRQSEINWSEATCRIFHTPPHYCVSNSQKVLWVTSTVKRLDCYGGWKSLLLLLFPMS